MIICPNCNHQNPEGSVQCESCYTPLPSTSPCPNCGALVQTDATFCGQCGFNLQGSETVTPQAASNSLDGAKVTAVNFNEQFQSPWDDEIANDIVNDPTEVTAQNSPEKTTIPPDLDFVVEEENLEEIANDTENTDDLESWLASMQLEESPQESESNLEEIPELFAPETTNSESEAEIPDLLIPETSIPDFASEPEVSVSETISATNIPETSIPEFTSEPEIPDLPLSEIPAPDLAVEPEMPVPQAVSETNIPETSIPEFTSEPEIPDLPLSEIPAPDLAVEPEIPVPPAVSEANIPDLSISGLETQAESSVVEETPKLEISELSTSERKTASEKVTSVPESTSFPPMNSNSPNNIDTSTRLQLQKATLAHVQTGTNLEMPLNLPIVRIGKPNNQVPPDIDVSGFPNAEIVSRIHAEIRVEGDTYFVEDRGSSNGTYVNHSPLLTGNRHRLRSGDRISLGKGDLMTFIFQVEQL